MITPEWHNPAAMEEGSRRTLRADAERNRRRLLDAATEMFGERGLDVSVGEIAQQAGVGRGTLFRNFPTKEHLISAILVERMNESIARGREALDAPDAGEGLFDLIEQAVARSRTDRALFDSLTDTWLANEEIRGRHTEMLGVLDALVQRAQDAGVVRADISAVDVLMMIKGVCESTGCFAHVNPDVALRQLDLVRGAIMARPDQPPLRGRRPTIEDLEQSKTPAAAPAADLAASA
ncbi:MAG: TetR family transcriptional regulator [Solirubrobacteraceae bacterium]